jgi:hypothetical protein
MKKIKTNLILSSIIILTAVCLTSCTQMSESAMNESAGFNGGFEITENGLPVNWLVYTKKTAGSGDFDIITDTTDFTEGKQSLKFQVRSCADKGDRFSPGIAHEMEAIAGETYKVSFLLKNSGCKYYYKIKGVSLKSGADEPMLISSEKTEGWKLIANQYTIPAEMNRLRFELNVISPGSFWIDDVKIEKVFQPKN